MKELKELNKVIANYMKQDSVKEITLQDNALDRSAVPHLCELLDLCPYVTKLDLRRNKLDSYAIGDLQANAGWREVLRDIAKWRMLRWQGEAGRKMDWDGITAFSKVEDWG